MSKNFNEFMITDGDIEIELMLKDKNDSGVGVQRGGIPTTTFDPSAYYRHLTSEEELLFVENWVIVIKEDCPDDFATLSRRLFSLLIRAWLYRGTQRYKDKGPVYLVQRVRLESNTRYARIHSSPILRMMQPLFNHELEMAGLVSDIGFPIARFAWETDAPGTIPTTKNNFDRTNGGADPATIVPIANHYDDHAIDTIQVYEDSVGYEFRMQLADGERGDTGDFDSVTPVWDNEAGELADFDAVTDADNDLNDSVDAAHDGAVGLELTFDDANVAYGRLNATAIDQTSGVVPIWFNTNTLEMDDASTTILHGFYDGANAIQWYLQFRNNAGTFQMRAIAVDDAAALQATAYYDLADGWNRIVFMFDRSTGADDGFIMLFIGDDLQERLDGIDNDTKDWDYSRSGMVATTSATFGGSYYFDTVKIDPVGTLFADKLAAMEGQYGYAIPIMDTTARRGDFTAPADEQDCKEEFYLDPNALVIVGTFRLFLARMDVAVAGVTACAIVEIRAAGLNYEVRLSYWLDDATLVALAWIPITDDAHIIRVELTAATAPAANDGIVGFYVDDVFADGATGLDTDLRLPDEFEYGAVGSVDAGTYGIFYIDQCRWWVPNAAIFPQPASVDDIYYVGSDEPFWNITWNITTAAVESNAVYLYEYSDGGVGWPDLTLGDDLSLYSDDDPFDALGTAGMFFHPGDDWAPEDVNGITRFWIRITIVSFTSYTTSPVTGTYLTYNQRQPYALLNADELLGDVPPLIQLRMLGTDGGDGDVEMTNISRILVGAKSRNLDEFDSHFNCGGDGMPSGWVVTYGTDTSSVADPEVSGGDEADCSFATDTTSVMRVRFTGTDKAEAYRGKYRPFLKCQQIGGDPGDVTVKLRIRINSTSDYAPQIDTSPIILESADDGHELVDLAPGNYMQIPFGDFYEADSLEGADLIIEVFALVAAGPAATMEFYELILLPVDEWWGEYEDPITNSEFGTSALRGEKILIDDGGVVENRTGMFKVDGSEEWFTELWERHGKPPTFVPLYGDTYRLHFIFAYFNATWAVLPMLSITGMGIMLEWITRSRYLYLRGDD